MFGELLQMLMRHKNPVMFEDQRRTRPINTVFGLDRGTPIDRHYIDGFLSNQAELVRGRVLEIADSNYSKRFGGDRVKSFEVLHANADNPAATIVGDLTNPATLPANHVDCFICTQTFHVIYDIRGALEGAHHLLKPGGVLLATLPGISQISRYDMDRWGDYWRFTTASTQRLFEEVFGGRVEVASFGNVMAACALLQGVAVEDLPDPKLLDEQDPDYQVLITVIARKAA